MEIREAKQEADNLAAHLKAVGVEVKRSQILELISRLGGVKNWRAWLAKLKSEVPIQRFVMASESEEGFWSNADGWGDLSSATVFTLEETRTLKLPSIGGDDCKWVLLNDAETYLNQDVRYVRHKGLRCPCCHSDNLTGNSWNADAGTATQEMGCDNCGATWQDVYTLTGVFVEDEGSPASSGDVQSTQDEEGEFTCPHCGGQHQIKDAVHMNVGLICDCCADGDAAYAAIEDWQHLVKNGDTKLGFAEWMAHEREAAEFMSQKSITDIRREAAERAFENWEFPLPVEATSGWDCSTLGDVASWDRSVFLQNEFGGDSVKVSFGVRFKGIKIEEVYCHDSYGDCCGQTSSEGNHVTLRVVADDQKLKKFELSLKGYDGSTSDTDHLVLWVSADSRQVVLDCICSDTLRGLVTLNQQLPCGEHVVVDFELPAQAEQFGSRVLELLKGPLIQVTLELLEEDGGVETVEFHASDVLSYHMPNSTHGWDDLSEQDQTSFAEDYALWSAKRKFGDHREYRAEIAAISPSASPKM